MHPDTADKTIQGQRRQRIASGWDECDALFATCVFNAFAADRANRS
jgi:hypothetical protein